MPGRFLSAVLVLLAAAPAAGEQIGVAVQVRPEVLGYLPGAAAPVTVVERASIERGETVELKGRTAYLKVLFNMGGAQTFSGVATLAGTARMEVEPPEAPRTLKMLLGRLWLSLLPGDRVDVDTPQGVLGVKGTALRVLVDPQVGTFLAVDEGLVSVQAKAGGEAVDVKKGEWVLIPPGGLPTRPAPLGPDDEFREDPLLPCCPGGEPPKPPPGRSP
jgi:hypothetical protein